MLWNILYEDNGKLSCQFKNTMNKNSSVRKSKQSKLIVLSN